MSVSEEESGADADGDADAHPGDRSDADEAAGGRAGTDGGESLGWRGWVVVGALVVALVIIPWAIVALPQSRGVLESFGLGLRDAYLVLPFIPAAGLGVLAVWAAVASRSSA